MQTPPSPFVRPPRPLTIPPRREVRSHGNRRTASRFDAASNIRGVDEPARGIEHPEIRSPAPLHGLKTGEERHSRFHRKTAEQFLHESAPGSKCTPRPVRFLAPSRSRESSRA
jgi:hypothetical protein